jgi:hypothetical protein
MIRVQADLIEGPHEILAGSQRRRPPAAIVSNDLVEGRIVGP